MSAQAATSVGPTAGASLTLFSCFAGMGAGLVELSIASSYISGRGPLVWRAASSRPGAWRFSSARLAASNGAAPVP
ncbi:hypothetical protein AHiyo8_14550 [Arthrobacter sp. Hiyo8]|nr:hypothetical protein AHiyo8_14550 [Arthrobacter sp. Hiyo8]